MQISSGYIFFIKAQCCDLTIRMICSLFVFRAMTERNKYKIELISAICIPSYKPAKARSCPCGDQLLPNQPLYPACFTPAVGIEKCDNATWVCWDLQLKHKPSTFMSYRVSNSLTEGQFAFKKTFSSTLFHNNKIEEKVCQVILQYCFYAC